LLKDTQFQQKDPVTFEVMMVKGQAEAVRLAGPEMDPSLIPSIDEPLPDNPNLPDFTTYSKQVEENDLAEEPASMKSQKRRQREEADTRCLFFGGFGPEISEATLEKFASQAGKVTKVKIFLHTNTWESKGCGKVQYCYQEDADRAINEISGTILNDRIVNIDRLGQNSSTNPNPKKQRPAPNKQRDDFTDDMPKQLPLSLFNPSDGPKQKLDVCIAAFEDLLKNHNADATGISMILMIRKLVMEVNDIFGEDEETLQTWCQHLRVYPWFRENMQVVKWQASKKRVNISKISSNQPLYISKAQTLQMQVEQRKREQEMMGKPIFEVPDDEKAKMKPFPAWTQKGGWGAQGYGQP
jgi:RNA recognition motif-containing protein